MKCEDFVKLISMIFIQLHANTSDNLDKIDKFLQTYNLPKLN